MFLIDVHYTGKFASRRIASVLASVLILVSCSPSNDYISITGYAQGGTYTVKLNQRTSEGRVPLKPVEIKEAIDSIILALDNSVSGYNKGSLLSRFNSGETIVPDEIFKDIYKISYGFYLASEGAFDVSSGPLFDIWGFGFDGTGFPSDRQIDIARRRCGMNRLKQDMESVIASDGTLKPVDLLKDSADESDGLPILNYNAIAQGYTCDLIAGYLYSLGIEDMLIDVGGEIFCAGNNPSGKAWRIGVDRPVDGNETPGADIESMFDSGSEACGIVTSGNYRKFYVKDGKKYAHTIDPRTGYPVSHSLLSATVIASDATTADALATYCMVIGYEQAKKFIETGETVSGTVVDGLSGHLIYDSQGEMCAWSYFNR